MCLISDFKGEGMVPGDTFHGHGLMTWDAVKKKYVGSWTDSMSMGLALKRGHVRSGREEKVDRLDGRARHDGQGREDALRGGVEGRLSRHDRVRARA